MSDMNELIAERDRIGREIIEELQKRFPVGTRLSVPAGRGQANVKVVGHGSYWSDPTRLQVENLNTGRVSSVDGMDGRVERLAE